MMTTTASGQVILVRRGLFQEQVAMRRRRRDPRASTSRRREASSRIEVDRSKVLRCITDKAADGSLVTMEPATMASSDSSV